MNLQYNINKNTCCFCPENLFLHNKNNYTGNFSGSGKISEKFPMLSNRIVIFNNFYINQK